MSLIKLALMTSEISEDPKDPRLLAATERQKPQPSRVKPNKAILKWGMKK